ncbi:MAG: beta-phosphoglucomutase [Spirochaetaceae bacterium]|nr:beta-phosphoglucomutase [Spirochaetaceae bacterium]
MIRAAIFDLDGVVVDTSAHHYAAWKSLADEMEIPFDQNENERLKGVSRMESLEIILSLSQKPLHLSVQQKSLLASKKNEAYMEAISRLSPKDLLPGVREFITDCRKHEMKTAIASASRNAPSVISSLRISSLFDTIVDGNRVHNAKPDPEVFLVAASILDIPPEDCVVFEDAAAGVEGALKAGMRCVGVGDPSTLFRAHYVISGFSGLSLKDLIELL